ncbi:MAG: pyruvate dehydrogenase (acetyl-transferring) E1 component subunit alpha [Actinobacteria bacterium]|nr:pyruvate dehydrogenase (acetyl-transferring) E1 component subunit alpha [Actinomycetota bacterium]
MALLSDDVTNIVQLIDERGQRSPGPWPAELEGRLVELYSAMTFTRALDEEFVALQRQGELALYPSCRGQEAAQIGAAAAMRSDDWLVPQYRELGALMQHGVDPIDIGLAWRGTWHAGVGFVEHHATPICVPIGTQTLHAVGSALASNYLGDDLVTVTFLGDGATSTGDVHEALNLAALRHAPVVFFVQNNGWAISVPTARQCAAPAIADRGAGYSMPSVRVDGNDVAACFAVVAQAIDRARHGGGPTLVEALTYRIGAHTTADDPTRYRDDAEVAAWLARDPIERVHNLLRDQGRWGDAEQEALQRRAAERRLDLRAAIVDAPDHSPLDVFDFVYDDPTDELGAQRSQLDSELRTGAVHGDDVDG